MPERVAGVPAGQQAQAGKEEVEDRKKPGAGEGGETVTKAKEGCQGRAAGAEDAEDCIRAHRGPGVQDNQVDALAKGVGFGARQADLGKLGRLTNRPNTKGGQGVKGRPHELNTVQEARIGKGKSAVERGLLVRGEEG